MPKSITQPHASALRPSSDVVGCLLERAFDYSGWLTMYWSSWPLDKHALVQFSRSTEPKCELLRSHALHLATYAPLLFFLLVCRFFPAGLPSTRTARPPRECWRTTPFFSLRCRRHRRRHHHRYRRYRRQTTLPFRRLGRRRPHTAKKRTCVTPSWTETWGRASFAGADTASCQTSAREIDPTW